MSRRQIHPVERRALAARLRRLVTAATAPGDERERSEAAAAARDLAAEVGAILIRETLQDDDFAAALAEYLEALGEGFGGWRS